MAATEFAEDAAVTPAHHGKVGVLGAGALVAGSMVGSGVYLLPATLGAIGSISILGWGAATLAALAIAGLFAWLGGAAPDAKGLPGYVQAGAGPFFGVQTTVAYWSCSAVGNVAIALAVAGAAGYFLPALNATGPRLAVTLAATWLSIAAAWIGPRMVARLEGLTLGIGLLPVALAATVGWFWFHPSIFIGAWNPQGLSLTGALGASALNAFWAFLGVECAAATAAVVRDPARNVPRATLAGVVGVAILYVAACTALMGVLPSTALAASTAPFADAAKATLGLGMAGAIAACALLRAQGCLTGWTLVAAETTRGAADEGVFPAAFRTRPGEKTSPINLVAVGGVMSLTAVLTASPTLAQQFTTVANVAVLLALYAYCLAGVSLLRLGRAFTPGRRLAASLTALAAMGASIALIASAKPVELALALVPPAIAALLYLWLRRR